MTKQIGINEIKPGMKVVLDNSPYVIINNEFVKPGKGQAFNRMKLKNMLTGRVVEKTYKSSDKLQLADIEETQMRLLYTEMDSAVFMDDKTFEQTHVPFSLMHDKKQWLKDDVLYDLILYNNEVIDIIPPTFMELKITEASPGIRGDTASGRVLKPAILESGAKIQVPIFINEGEIIKVDTRTSEYVSRV